MVDYTHPPMYKPDGDLLLFRQEVKEWIDFVKKAATKGKDRHIQTVYGTLAEHLFLSLPHAQKKLITEYREAKKIDFDQDDQIKGVKDIVDIIATEPNIAVVNRLIDSFNQVQNCRRRRDEDLITFASRFRGLAADHLMNVGVSADSQFGEVLAITLLNNANISPESLMNAKLELVKISEAYEGLNSNNSLVSIPTDDLDHINDCREILDEMNDFNSLSSSETDSPEDLLLKIKSFQIKLSQFRDKFESMEDMVARHEESSEKPEDTKSITAVKLRALLRLDDAVKVIRSLAHSSGKSYQTQVTKNDVQNIVGDRVSKALYSLNKSNKKSLSDKPTNGNGNSGNQSGRTSFKPRPKKSGNNRSRRLQTYVDKFGEICFDCGSDDHERGDLKCQSPSHLTLLLKTSRDEATPRDSQPPEKKPKLADLDNHEESKQYFRKGSSSSKRN